MNFENIKKSFETKTVFTASDKELIEALVVLSNETSIDNNLVAMALTINSIKSQRHIDRIEKRNQVYTWIIIVLTTVSILKEWKALLNFFCKFC